MTKEVIVAGDIGECVQPFACPSAFCMVIVAFNISHIAVWPYSWRCVLVAVVIFSEREPWSVLHSRAYVLRECLQ